ncbi:hypothetical protein LTR85_006147 [Meristemomyces frigidus]|nr:hypothetical protein LTR85_006147 [Meristemomyces frigidus]
MYVPANGGPQNQMHFRAVATADNRGLIQGAPATSMRGALEALLLATMEAMNAEREGYFFIDNDPDADTLPRSGGLMYNGGVPGRFAAHTQGRGTGGGGAGGGGVGGIGAGGGGVGIGAGNAGVSNAATNGTSH